MYLWDNGREQGEGEGKSQPLIHLAFVLALIKIEEWDLWKNKRWKISFISNYNFP